MTICAGCARDAANDPCEHCGEPPLLDGRYRLLEVLGHGSSGTTWGAVDPVGIAVAIKAMPLPAGGEGDKQRELVEREVRVLRELSHPGIPRYLEHFLRGGPSRVTLFLVQELVPGRSLAEEAEEHRYSAMEVLAIVDELASILQYLHERVPPVIHRDVKPQNVMRRPDRQLVLIDFGSVRDVAQGSLGGSTVTGTFGYMPPEQFSGDAEPRSDLYGLGALAIALLTRKEPHSLLDHANRLHWAAHTRVPAGIHDLVSRLVELGRRASSAAWVRRRACAMLELGDIGRAELRADPRVDEILEPKPRGLRWWVLACGLLVAVGMIPAAILLMDLPAAAPRSTAVAPPPIATEEIPGEPGSEDELAEVMLQRVARALGEDPDVLDCVDRFREEHPGSTLELQVRMSPPYRVDGVLVGHPGEEDSQVEPCLQRTTRQVVFGGVSLERAGSVTLAFD